MSNVHCEAIKNSLLSYLQGQLEVSTVRGLCVVTLPFRTLDDRSVDVYIEPRFPDYFLVHDAGSTVGEFFAQGVNLTPAKSEILAQIASRYGIALKDEMFVTGSKLAGLQNAIFAVGQCASLAMTELLRHKPTFEEDPVVSRVGTAVDEWGSLNRARVERKVIVEGQSKQHQFDFVAHLPSNEPSIAISVLSPSEPQAKAERYGFLALDVERTAYVRAWKRLAVLAKSDRWSLNSVRLIERHAQAVVELPGSGQFSNSLITEALNHLRAA